MSELNNNLQQELKQLIQNSKNTNSKLGSLSGFLTTMRGDLNDEFKKLHKKNQQHLNTLIRKADIHFCIMIIFTYCLFLITYFKEPCFLFIATITQTLQHNILIFFNLFNG